MKELLLYIARNLVDHPDEVTVTEREEDGETTLELRVADGDMGKVIGRQGRIAKEIRTLVRSYAQRTGAPMEVVENLQEIEDEGDVYESIEDIWPDYPTKEDFLFNEDEY